MARSPSSLLPQPVLGAGKASSSPVLKSSSSTGLLPQPVLGAVPKAERARSPLQMATAADRALVSGIGGLGFRSLSPPGAGRLVRIPFYPYNPSQSWTGVDGIDGAGDDPILNLTIPAGFTKSDRLTMLTYQFDYGAYKILGLQTNFQGSYDTGLEAPPPGNVPTPVPGFSPQGVGIGIGNLALYNGQTLFVQLDDMDASTFQLLPDFKTSIIQASTGTGSQREDPYNYMARRSSFFPGMRDYPVVFGTANVTMQVSAFIANVLPVDVNIPFSCYIIADLVEDYVFGDPVNPSASSRAGANLKLGAKDMGVSRVGTRQYDLTSARFKPTKS